MVFIFTAAPLRIKRSFTVQVLPNFRGVIFAFYLPSHVTWPSQLQKERNSNTCTQPWRCATGKIFLLAYGVTRKVGSVARIYTTPNHFLLWHVRKICEKRLVAVYPSVRPHGTTPTGRVLMKFDTWALFRKSIATIKSFIKIRQE